MKLLSRLGRVGAVVVLLGCGGEVDGPAVGAQPTEMKVRRPAAASLPKAPEAPPGDPAAPGDPGEPGEPGEGIDCVRETGFTPSMGEEPEDECIDCVRETGFVPAPVLELLAVEAGRARLRWQADRTANRFRVAATRYGSDGLAVRSDEYVVEYTSFDLPLDGYRTLVWVGVVDDSGKPRSKQSNTVEIPGR
jgi:hypothetical protein